MMWRGKDKVMVWVRKTTLSYTAGIIDGEGYVSITGNPKYSLSLSLRVSVELTNEALVRWFEDTFGGVVYYRPPEKAVHKPTWTWTIRSKDALKFLKVIYPYLRLKKPQAEVAIKFYEQRPKRKGHALQEDEKVFLEIIRTEMSILNKRGV